MQLPKLLLPVICWLMLSGVVSAQTQLSSDFQLDSSLKAGESHLYEISLKKDGYAEVTFLQQGVDLKVTLLNAQKDSIGYLDSPNGPDGPETYQLLATYSGKYYFRVEPLKPEDEGLSDKEAPEYKEYVEVNQGDYRVEQIKVLSPKAYREWQAELAARRQRIIDWFAEKSRPLKRVEAGNGFEDLQFLKPVLKEVEIVGLGEATHGTREFFQMKHRMLEFLVLEMGFRVFAIEASYPACQNINDYVLHGIGTKEQALASQGFWTWDTEEVLDMIEWMRAYNLTVPGEERVQFLGYDVQVMQRSVEQVDTFLASTDTVLSAKFREVTELSSSVNAFDQVVDTALVTEVDRLYHELLADMVLSEGRLIHCSTPAAYARGMEHLRVLIQSWRRTKARELRRLDPEMRDYYMGENILYLRSKLPPGTKMVVWAHNFHIAADPNAMVNGGIKPMGAYLREALGDAYYTIAFAFNQGGFQARFWEPSGNRSILKGYTVAPAKINSLEEIFAQTPHNIAFLNLRQPIPGDAGEFFNLVETFNTGAAFFPRWREDGNYLEVKDFTRHFDGIIFVETTTRAHPSESVKKRLTVE